MEFGIDTFVYVRQPFFYIKKKSRACNVTLNVKYLYVKWQEIGQ